VAEWLEEVGGAVIADTFRRAGLEIPEDQPGIVPEILSDTPPRLSR